MKNQLAQQVRRVEVTDLIAAARRYDYADAFEVRLPEPDPYPPETWVRARSRTRIRPKRGYARVWGQPLGGWSGSWACWDLVQSLNRRRTTWVLFGLSRPVPRWSTSKHPCR
jgi:hypothetical protein